MTANPLEDQMDAAEREAEKLFTTTGKFVGGEITCAGPLGTRVAEEFQTALELPGARMCPHLGATGPQPFFGAACLPGVVACVNCLRPLVEAKRFFDAADGKGRTCDACKQKSMSGHDGLIHYGMLLLQVSLCCECAEHETC